MAAQTEWYTERGYAFGRGSPVRDYWLTRCEGFEAIDTNGQRLGRVRRVETSAGGVFLRLDGRRSPVVPASGVERVWPAASLLVIADPEFGEPSRAAEPHVASSTAPSQWEDETLPWWDLIPETGLVREAARERRVASASTAARGAVQRDVATAQTAGRQLGRWTRQRSRKVAARAGALGRRGWDVTRAATRVVRAQRRAARSFSVRAFTSARRRLGRLLARLAVWVAGGDEHLGNTAADDRRASSF